MKRALALISLAGSAALLAVFPAASMAGRYELTEAHASLSTTKAGGHPDLQIGFEVATDPESKPNNFGLHEPNGTTHEVRVELPPGFLGNLNAVPHCTLSEFNTFNDPEGPGGCPNAAQVGVTSIYAYELTQVFHEPVYLMDPPQDGRAVARLGFVAGPYPTFIEIHIRSESDYGVTAVIGAASSRALLVKADTTLWGVPAAPSHDTERQTMREAITGAASSEPRPPHISARPFLTNPTACGAPGSVAVTADSYKEERNFSTLPSALPQIAGCDQVGFAPSLTVTPTNRAADSPTGLDALLSIPQDESATGRATSALRNSVVTLPEGMTINPGAADGLAACSAEEARYRQPGPAQCPEAAKIGTAEFDVPALERPLQGAVYQRTPEPGRLFGLWLIADEQGVDVKIPGEIEADPLTGRLTTRFLGTPQVPLRGLRLHLKEGARAPLSTPATCGTYQTSYDLSPWSGSAPVIGTTPMRIDQGCAPAGFSPRLSAGSTVPLAGRFSSFVMNLTRADAEQDISRLAVDLPKGVLAKLAGVAICSDAAAAGGACPADSRVGSVQVATGSGPNPLWLPQPGKAPTAVYLGGPYKGGPYSLVVVVPAQAGPFDLGTVVSRAQIDVDPSSARVAVRSDALPQMLEGVPISYRSIGVSIDRPEFVLNPTNCGNKAVEATVTSEQGSVATPSSRFAAAGCAGLGFAPKLSLSLKGGTRRTSHPALKSVLTFPKRDDEANTARAEVLLPESELIDNAHIQSPCTRVQFNANACPPGSVLGTAKAYSPLLDRPLEGPVYFRSNGGERTLPDVVADLHGQIHIVLVGFVDSVHRKGEGARIRTTFGDVPDAPVRRFELNLNGGKKGLLVNANNLCARPPRAVVRFTGQNGKKSDRGLPVATSCRKGRSGR
jgi:hypothetical protein